MYSLIVKYHITQNTMIKINDADKYESIVLYLDEEHTPIAFKNKLEEVLSQNVFDSEEEAKEWLRTTPFELEIYYEQGYGLFGVEPEAVEAEIVSSPYSGEKLCENEQGKESQVSEHDFLVSLLDKRQLDEYEKFLLNQNK